MNTALSMQTNQLKIDSFCRPITPATNDQPKQPAVPELQSAPLVPSRKRRIIIHDSDSDEGRAIVQTPGENAESTTESNAAMQAPAVTTSGATDAATARAVPRTIHTETVTQVHLRIARIAVLTHQRRHSNRLQKGKKSTHLNKMRRNLKMIRSLMMQT